LYESITRGCLGAALVLQPEAQLAVVAVHLGDR
jgi:endonuclease/exonuclease/phosphatase family metal-dependent hydrolase